MAKISDIIIDVRISFWNAIKLRIAGLKGLDVVNEENHLKIMKKK